MFFLVIPFLAIPFSVISTLLLVLSSLFAMFVGVASVVLGGLISFSGLVIFKLLVVLVAIISKAGIAKGLLVGAKTTSQFIIKKLPGQGISGMARVVNELDLAQIIEGGATVGKTVVQWSHNALSILLMARDTLSTVGLVFHSAIHTAKTALHHTVNTESTSNVQRSILTEETSEEIAQPTAVPAPIKDERIEPIDISNLSDHPESPARI